MAGRRTVVITLVLILLCLWGAAEIAAEVMEQGTPAIDQALLRFMRSPAGDHPAGPPWLEKLLQDIDALGGFFPLTLFSLAFLAWLLFRRWYRASLLLAVIIAGGGGWSLLLKSMFNRPRPDVVVHGGSFTSSFPSGHAMMALIVYLVIGAVLGRLQATPRQAAFFLLLAVFLALLIGATRVYLGMHWPTDVAAGWLIGLAWTLACWLAARRLQKKGKIEPDVPIPGA